MVTCVQCTRVLCLLSFLWPGTLREVESMTAEGRLDLTRPKATPVPPSPRVSVGGSRHTTLHPASHSNATGTGLRLLRTRLVRGPGVNWSPNEQLWAPGQHSAMTSPFFENSGIRRHLSMSTLQWPQELEKSRYVYVMTALSSKQRYVRHMSPKKLPLKRSSISTPRLPLRSMISRYVPLRCGLRLSGSQELSS